MNIETVNELIASLESAGELSIREQKFLKLAKAYQQLAAENVAMHETIEAVRGVADNSSGIAGWHLNGEIAQWSEILPEIDDIETPATDRIVAGIRADGRAEGINFAASRLAAAFNHGFVDKPMAEVGDVVRMILDAKADLANDPVLAADGLSGEYAEKSLAEWEAALSEGADK
ncbi:hypothetical protein [Klebsiella pneumoniae]|uniref:hypothetical protein n=1 Tax=Klebsiella pneumoniae TaxID=573 RepID=UPI00058A0924|nr:hypothetical protein [Klebsiella pneumoniae]PHK68281.1 hypothetical protein CQR95_07670 [Klebsiella pneumoniae subsp. pneumoniae]PVW48474.1 hypothetical protein B4U26_21225 [Klebsiella pneumoniae]RCI24206.1 hypothetical protein DT360_09440 [Klebsiella pneumoniae]